MFFPSFIVVQIIAFFQSVWYLYDANDNTGYLIACACSFEPFSNMFPLFFLSLQILFVAGLSFVIGLERTFRFFFQKHKMKATSFFLGGVFVVLIGWPIIGVLLEIYGFFLLFR